MTTAVRIPSLSALPPPWPEDVLPAIRTQLANTARTLVVLDDDPTGTQTVHDVAVVTQWDEATLGAELATGAACFYILTNSRSLPAAAAAALNRELAGNLHRASARTGRAFTLVSRSDSTLRGHYPVETDALTTAAGPFDATLIAPYFQAGGRFTIGNVHYVAEGDTLVPAADTPFARDATFGYRSSDLRAWIEEKTGGRVRAADVAAVSLDDIRCGGPDAVVARLRPLRDGAVGIVNACTPRDIEVVSLASLRAEQAGRRFLYRTAASFVAARIGQAPRPLLGPAELSTSGTGGGIVVVGSYVPKTTAQLAALRARHPLEAVELPVDALLDPAQRELVIQSRAGQLDALLAAGRDAVLFTSRAVVTGTDADASLAIGRVVSDSLIAVLRALRTQPRFVIAKGGITSSDVATRALDVRRAVVRGQILPGVPVWRLGPESRCPGLDYVVFPGNVGGDSALAEAYDKFRPPPTP